ncbi:aldehyde dehydrogenase family protein [Halostreptopolyspora alba]|uniref:Aldehyde dehydrogenase family protein n=1 Tax=Halostreptopolyspora alba TaxID=2487137 RepID=A0A3N0DR48_9ACTN|nr:aldehyde dehydrogenase family protein [Nocardiopsaceae bacterium YIM 96095]
MAGKAGDTDWRHTLAEAGPRERPEGHDGTPGEHAVGDGARIAVRRTHKLYLGGAFPRSESGRSYPVTSAEGHHLANAAAASRKDARDAVVAARAAFDGWSGRTGHNRGQILYRAAEMMEGRRAQFVSEVVDADGVSGERAETLVSAAIDRWVYHAGWADKFTQVIGGTNQVLGSYLSLSSPEPTGVVGIVAPPKAPLLGLVSVVAPVIATGNTAVVVASERAPLPAVTLAEVLATSDLPGGVVNILTGRLGEIAPHLATHADVNALDLAGAGDLATGMEEDAAATLKRVVRPEADTDWTADPGLSRITPFLELKTVWHPIGG